MAENIIKTALRIADEKYADNAAVCAIAADLRITQTRAYIRQPFRSEHGALLAGYRRGAQGDEGYTTSGIRSGLSVDSMLDEIAAIQEVDVVTRVLVLALKALGETLDY
jgi:hypothetical protein